MKFSNQNRNRIIALLSMLAAGILIGQIFSTAERTVQAKVQKELADEVLRFHVLANSDSTLDQEMKLCVRNEILEFLQTEMPTGAGAEATKEWVRSHCDEIEQTAEKCLTEKGYDDPVNAAVTTTYSGKKVSGYDISGRKLRSTPCGDRKCQRSQLVGNALSGAGILGCSAYGK